MAAVAVELFRYIFCLLGAARLLSKEVCGQEFLDFLVTCSSGRSGWLFEGWHDPRGVSLKVIRIDSILGQQKTMRPRQVLKSRLAEHGEDERLD